MRGKTWQYKAGAPGIAVVAADNKVGNTFVVRGYASRFDEVDAGGDRTKPGAFRFVKTPLPLLYAHEVKARPPIGVVNWAGEDRIGWLFEATIPSDTVRGYEIKRLVELGGLSGVSYGYDTIKSKPGYVGGQTVRDLILLKVGEISLVAWPMLDSARLLSWGSKLADVLHDRIVIAKYDQAAAEGTKEHPMQLLRVVEAAQRESERLSYDGLTWDEWSVEMLREIVNARWELEAMG